MKSAAAAAAAAQSFRFLFRGALRAVSSLFPSNVARGSVYRRQNAPSLGGERGTRLYQEDYNSFALEVDSAYNRTASNVPRGQKPVLQLVRSRR